MALEGQAVNAAEMQAQVIERAAVFAETPRRLWDAGVVLPTAQRSDARRRRKG